MHRPMINLQSNDTLNTQSASTNIHVESDKPISIEHLFTKDNIMQITTSLFEYCDRPVEIKYYQNQYEI